MKPNPNRALEMQSRAAKFCDMLAQDTGTLEVVGERLVKAEVALAKLTSEVFSQAKILSAAHRSIDPNIVTQGFTDIGTRIQKIEDLMQGLSSHVEDLERRSRPREDRGEHDRRTALEELIQPAVQPEATAQPAVQPEATVQPAVQPEATAPTPVINSIVGQTCGTCNELRNRKMICGVEVGHCITANKLYGANEGACAMWLVDSGLGSPLRRDDR